jgi:hypothetical protein
LQALRRADDDRFSINPDAAELLNVLSKGNRRDSDHDDFGALDRFGGVSRHTQRLREPGTGQSGVIFAVFMKLN